MSFDREGHTVARKSSSFTSDTPEPPGAFLRPALVAVDGFPADVAWHDDLISGVFANTYVPRMLACLDAKDDGRRFYEELNAAPDTMLPYLCKAGRVRHVRHVDARMVPLLAAYAWSGTDEFFEALCSLAARIETREIDPTLRRLLQRWARSFDLRSREPQQTDNHFLWRAFSLLTSHPRFELIPDWHSMLSDAMRSNLRWYRKETIARVLERDPRSYLQIESTLFRTEDWLHYAEEEIDRLDEASERLFAATHS